MTAPYLTYERLVVHHMEKKKRKNDQMTGRVVVIQTTVERAVFSREGE
jgi:hypothetical protein